MEFFHKRHYQFFGNVIRPKTIVILWLI